MSASLSLERAHGMPRWCLQSRRAVAGESIKASTFFGAISGSISDIKWVVLLLINLLLLVLGRLMDVAPFFVARVVVLLMVTYIRWLSLWLPRAMGL